MKTRILMIALMGISFAINAQQNQIGPTGNVGIGTLSPTHKLHVNNGASQFITYSYGAEITVKTTGGWARGFRIRNENDNKTAVYGALNGSAYISTGFDIASDATGYKNQRLTVKTNGNVGIGITNPSQRLDVIGSIKASGNVMSNNYRNISGGVMLSYASSRISLGANKLIVAANGNIGIGTLSPTHKLHINLGASQLKTYTYGAEVTVNTGGGWARAFRLRNENDDRTAVFGSLNGSAYISTGFDIAGDATGYKNQKFTVTTDGDVGIGTTNTKGFKLGVNGKIAATEVKVAMFNNWADFVFDENYELPSLTEVENHIQKHGHLKDIPSAEEVEKDGFFLGEMDAKLLQKIEELTLYTIEQEKEITQLKNQTTKIEKLEVENLELKIIVNQLQQIQTRLEKLEKE